jgi:hypothetical protein
MLDNLSDAIIFNLIRFNLDLLIINNKNCIKNGCIVKFMKLKKDCIV